VPGKPVISHQSTWTMAVSGAIGDRFPDGALERGPKRRRKLQRGTVTKGVVDTMQDLALLPSDLVERDPGLSQLSSAAVTGSAPAGPERRSSSSSCLVRRATPLL
jgi:hypothetical protein